jgi:hypothetical protein
MFSTKDSSDNFIAGVMGSVFEASGLDTDMTRNKVEKKREEKYGFMPYYIENGKVMVGLVFNIFNK